MKLEYLLVTALGIAGCASEQKQEHCIVHHIPIYNVPQPSANIKQGGELFITPEANIALTVTDSAQRRAIRNVRMYIVPQGKDSILLDISGSKKELEREGTAPFFINTSYQFPRIPEGPAQFILDVEGRGTGTYRVNITIRKQRNAVTLIE